MYAVKKIIKFWRGILQHPKHAPLNPSLIKGHACKHTPLIIYKLNKHSITKTNINIKKVTMQGHS